MSGFRMLARMLNEESGVYGVGWTFMSTGSENEKPFNGGHECPPYGNSLRCRVDIHVHRIGVCEAL